MVEQMAVRSQASAVEPNPFSLAYSRFDSYHPHQPYPYHTLKWAPKELTSSKRDNPAVERSAVLTRVK